MLGDIVVQPHERHAGGGINSHNNDKTCEVSSTDILGSNQDGIANNKAYKGTTNPVSYEGKLVTIFIGAFRCLPLF
jgi:hypothetical protein